MCACRLRRRSKGLGTRVVRPDLPRERLASMGLQLGDGITSARLPIWKEEGDYVVTGMLLGMGFTIIWLESIFTLIPRPTVICPWEMTAMRHHVHRRRSDLPVRKISGCSGKQSTARTRQKVTLIRAMLTGWLSIGRFSSRQSEVSGGIANGGRSGASISLRSTILTGAGVGCHSKQSWGNEKKLRAKRRNARGTCGNDCDRRAFREAGNRILAGCLRMV